MRGENPSHCLLLTELLLNKITITNNVTQIEPLSPSIFEANQEQIFDNVAWQDILPELVHHIIYFFEDLFAWSPSKTFDRKQFSSIIRK